MLKAAANPAAGGAGTTAAAAVGAAVGVGAAGGAPARNAGGAASSAWVLSMVGMVAGRGGGEVATLGMTKVDNGKCWRDV